MKYTRALEDQIVLAKDRAIDELQCILDDAEGQYGNLTGPELKRVTTLAFLLLEDDDSIMTLKLLKGAGFVSDDDAIIEI